MFKKVLTLIIFVKVLTFILIIIGFYFFTYNYENYEDNFHFPENEAISIKNTFKTWDAQHYLYLSEFWYQPGQVSISCYPLFPLIVRLFLTFIGDPLIAGLMVSNIFSILGILFFYKFTKKYFKNESIGSVIVLLAFPSSFYFSLIYSES